MELTELENQMTGLLAAMHESLDKQRWRRLPALHQRLMALYADYAMAQSNVAQLDAMKATLRRGLGEIIARREARAERLKARMEKHRQQRDGQLAYSMVNLVSEQA